MYIYSVPAHTDIRYKTCHVFTHTHTFLICEDEYLQFGLHCDSAVSSHAGLQLQF